MEEYPVDNRRRHQLDIGGSILTGASNVKITGSTFNTYGAPRTDKKKRIADAIEPLRSRAEQGAPYDAAAREDVPKCYEHTRVAIIEGIQKWANSQDPDARPFMWIYGPAGSGKTTIMQTVAEIFDKEESLAASFFFSRLSAARPSKKNNFVITLAHQLSLCIPALQAPLADALSDPSILTKSLPKQLDKLVTGPLKTLRPDQIGDRNILMVDGLDECEGDDSQRDVLKLLEQCAHQFGRRIRILVASRCLTHIQAFFSQSSIAETTQTMPLDNDYQTEEDITEYFIAEFRKIRDGHPSRLPSDWPCRPDIDLLVQRASGQFIYASVVMKFIADQGRHPNESLQTIIHLKVDGAAKPYEALDAVYAQVLSTVEPQNVQFIFTIMGCMLLKDRYSFSKAVKTEPTTIVDLLFNLQPGTTDARINRMSPLITKHKSDQEPGPFFSFDEETDGLLFSHASFPEYLLDQSRSKEFFVDMRKVHCRLSLRSFEIFSLRPGHNSSGRANDTRAGPSLRELIHHCQQAEWTPELQNAVLTFNLQTAFTPLPEWIKKFEQHIVWGDIMDWVFFITWCEYHHHISSPDAEQIRVRLHNMVQSVCSMLPSSHNIAIKVIAVLLTLHKDIDISECWTHLEKLLGDCEGRYFMYFQYSSSIGENDHVCMASHIWLSRTLAPDLEMDGPIFTDRNLYTNLALLYVQCILRPPNGNNEVPPSGAWMHPLGVMLSKSSPSAELASFLKQKFLQPGRGFFGGNNKKDVITGILIYLFECGIPYISEHRHAPDFDAYDRTCAICILFDPYKECVEIELSRDPSGALCPSFSVGTEQEDLPTVANPVRYGIPRIPILWLRVWIIWLANAMMRLFPVAT